MLSPAKFCTTIFLLVFFSFTALFSFTVESQAATFTIYNSGNEGGSELAQAVFSANTQTSSSHTVNFASNVHEVIVDEANPFAVGR